MMRKRYIREGFDNDEELAMYDLLIKESLTPSENKIQYIGKSLLERVKETISVLKRWTEKEETQAEVDVVIRNILCNELSESYDDSLMKEYRQKFMNLYIQHILLHESIFAL